MSQVRCLTNVYMMCMQLYYTTFVYGNETPISKPLNTFQPETNWFHVLISIIFNTQRSIAIHITLLEPMMIIIQSNFCL